jgi:colanic acid biosynthesis glycosyl transferase WcaI
LKILVVTQYFWPESFRVNELVRELVRRGHDVSVLTGIPNYPSGSTYPDFLHNPSNYDSYFGARVFRAPMLARGSGAFRLILNYLSFAICASVYAPFRLLKHSYDVVFVYQLSPVTVVLPAILLSRIKRIPLVIWVQDLWPDTLISLNIVSNPILVSSLNLFVGSIYSQAKLLLAQSRSFVNRLAEYVADPSLICYFPNWAEDFSTSCEIYPATEVPKDPGVFTILFAGNIGEAQDFPSVLDAAEVLKDNPNVRWIIVGSGRKKQWLQNEVISRGLSNCFLLLGSFPYERMPSFYKAADILFISLAKSSAFSLTIPSKLQSYLISGIPILGMLDGEGAQTILKAEAGFVCDAGNSSALVDAVRNFLLLPLSDRILMGKKGRLYALKEFQKNMLLDKLENLISSLT